MTPFHELTEKQKVMEGLRWFGVLPAAVFAYVAVGFIVSAAPSTHWLLLIFYMPKEVAFVIAGAKVAPRSRIATAIVLAAVGILKSLAIHLVGQNAGVSNYLHFGAESLGLVVGAAYIFYSVATGHRGVKQDGDTQATNRDSA